MQHPIEPVQGGTGVANNNASTISISGSHGLTLILTSTTSLTLPTSGTLATTTSLITASQMPAFSGDVTTTAGSTVTTIAANVVTNAKLAQMGPSSLKGNNTAFTANVADLTATQVTAMLNIFTSAFNGLTPASGGGTLNFLRADGSWMVPPGAGGTVTSVAFADGSATPIYTVTGSPVTTSGTLTITLATQSANAVLVGPVSGPAAQPTFRALVTADIPTISLTTGVNGTLQAAQFPALIGDVTTPGGSLTTTLATVNANTGPFGSSTQVGSFVVNGKGLITSASNVTIVVSNINGGGTGQIPYQSAANITAFDADFTFTPGNVTTLTIGNATAVTPNEVMITTPSGLATGFNLSLTPGVQTGAANGLTVFLTGGNGSPTSGNGGGVNLTGGLGTGGASLGAGGVVTIIGGTASSSGANAGGNVAVTGGPSSTAVGGTVTITGGSSGGTNNAGGGVTVASASGVGTGTGGTITLSAANGGSSDGNGGSINIFAGTGFGTGQGGVINLTGGTALGAAAGGSISLMGGYGGSTSGTGGNVTLQGGPAQATNAAGGQVEIAGGNSTGTGVGGTLTLNGGQGGSNGGNGGDIDIIGGFGTGSTSAVGGQVNLTGGTCQILGAGGDVNITGGTATGTSVPGGDVNIAAGTGGTVSGDGGSVSIAGGQVVSGTPGSITFITDNTTRFEIDGTGAWELAGSPGTSGQALISNGSGTPPTWDTITGIVVNTQSGSTYTFATTDIDTLIYSNDVGSQTITVPTALASGIVKNFTVSVYNNSSFSVTITPSGGVTLTQIGTGSTGARTLAQYGLATFIVVATDNWLINGVGVT